MTDDLLVKYLLGEADTGEQEQVHQWLAEAPDHQRYFDHFRLIWDKSAELAAKSTVSEEDAWQRFRERMERQEPEERSSRVMALPANRSWARAAAVLVLVACGGWLAYYLSGTLGQTMTLQTADNTLSDTLPDGSVVVLNHHSSLSYPKSFKGGTRTVELEGEAFFSITPDKKKPFIIHADETDVKVVGTSFNVKSSAERTEVVVETGIVEVAKKQYKVKLNPREMAVVLKDKPAPLKQTSPDELYSYYRTKEFVCKGTPLWRLVDVLNEAYNAHIVIRDQELKGLPLTARFRNESLDNILVVVGNTLNIKVEKADKQIILKKHDSQ